MFRVDAAGTVLLGGRSASSGLTHFPRRPLCPFTGADDVEPVDLPATGALWAWTTVESAPPGYTGEVPYALGVVELADGLRVVGRLVDTPSPSHGLAMVVTTDVVPGPEGEPRSVWAFTPSDGASGPDAGAGGSAPPQDLVT